MRNTGTPLVQDVRAALARLPWVRIFRNNTGSLPDPARPTRRIVYGLGLGSADLVGMVRMESGISRFFAVEVKSGTGRLSENQIRWIDAVNAFGGAAAVVRSVEEAVRFAETARRGNRLDVAPIELNDDR